MAKFDAIVSGIRRELLYPFEGLQVPPPCWQDEAFLAGIDRQLVVFAGTDEEVLRSFPYHQVPLRDFVVAGQDADYPLSKSDSLAFAEIVRSTDAQFDISYPGSDWQSQVTRLVIEIKLAKQVTDNEAARLELLSPLRDVLDAKLVLPPLPDPINLELVDPAHRDYLLETSLFMAAELQLSQPLQEQEAVRRIRKHLPQCPSNLIGFNARLEVANQPRHRINFRARQF